MIDCGIELSGEENVSIIRALPWRESMSSPEDKVKHSKRIHEKKTVIHKKVEQAKAYNLTHILKAPHKYLKCSIFSCGNPNCVFCMNPRKSFKERTIQEKRFMQKEKE